MNTAPFFDKNSQAFFYNLKPIPIQRMLDFDYLCQRDKPSISAIIHPEKEGFHKVFFGPKEMLLPVYKNITEATKKHPQTDILINFASFRSAYSSSKEALGLPAIKIIIIVAEGLPERQTKELIALAKEEQKMIIGPSTVGGIIAGKFRIGYAGGELENIIKAKLYRSGSVGLVSKSGGILNEMFNLIARTTDGINEGIAVGGDTFPGSTLLDHLLRFEANPEIKLMVVMSELGGKDEYNIIIAKEEGKLTKPLIIWVSGTSAQIFSWEVQFGHAGAKAGKEEESAQAKNKALKEAGFIVPDSFEELEPIIAEEFKTLVEKGIIEVKEEHIPPKIPKERKNTHFITSISSDLGEEPTYNNIPLSKLIAENSSVGDIIGLLWFKKKLPDYFTKFLELVMIIIADHGPAVSGAHNAIITSRAGKDIISSLCSGLLTIGPRFGGAIDDACRYFKEAYDSQIEPAQFVENMKKAGILIPGIGHKIKSKSNPDKRVELLKQYAQEHFFSTKHLNYALEVERITINKAENLILNVDGCIAALFLDALSSSDQFSPEEIKQIISLGYMNGLFALARSIGIIGHILDQKRLKTGLYRHPTEDICYLNQ